MRQSGFSTVELLVTLFIAFLFVMMGYQLYGATINDGGEARRKAVADSSALQALRQVNNSAQAQLTCTDLPASSSYTKDTATVNYTISCPQPTALPNLRKEAVTIQQNNSETTHVLYFNR